LTKRYQVSDDLAIKRITNKERPLAFEQCQEALSLGFKVWHPDGTVCKLVGFALNHDNYACYSWKEITKKPRVVVII
jgi:hypothetical protein